MYAYEKNKHTHTKKKLSGGVATTADANYCGPRLKRKTKIIKGVILYAGLKTATNIGVETARPVTTRTGT